MDKPIGWSLNIEYISPHLVVEKTKR